ncbi:MAG: tRNA (adenosine(37)-N6)-threonylcarbamoyltransferase complex dimerization subunit type 1 TsaB [Pyrinomonadaceae bacterium]
MSNPHQMILAIECAVSGGSLSLLLNGVEFANWVGTAVKSRAEDLLPEIEKLMSGNGVNKFDINQIAVSTGPGSFTGIRIGIATALGLKMGLNASLSSVSVLYTIGRAYAGKHKRSLVAVPAGRGAVCLQRYSFERDSLIAHDEPVSADLEDFVRIIRDETETAFLVHSDLTDCFDKGSVYQDIGTNLARLVGIEAWKNPTRRESPLFISKAF